MTRPPRPDNILDYESRFPTRLSRLAIVAFIVSICAVLGLILSVPVGLQIGYLLGIDLGLIVVLLFFAVICSFFLAGYASHRITKSPDKLAGLGLARAATNTSGITILLCVLAIFLLPTGGTSKTLAYRSSCAANLRGIMNSMIIYAAQNNEQFPIVTYAPYSPALNNPSATATYSSSTDAINAYYRAPYPQAGSVTANTWILAIEGMSPKLFICKSDPYVTGPAELINSAGRYYNNFQNDKQLSYSFAYPWKSDGTVGKWWTNTSDASLPLAADMAPEQNTGKPQRILNPTSRPADIKTWSSGNHDGDGQNVAFADVHVDYVKTPLVGQNNDNIWTTSSYTSTAPTAFGGLPAIKASPNLTADSPPYDIIMYPIRNLDTGRF